MSLSKRALVALMGFSGLFVIASARGENPTPPPPESAPPIDMHAQAVNPVERIGEGVFRIGKVVVNKKQRAITFPASVNMATGMLEYLLVRDGGKTHESLLRTDAEPFDIQLACLLLDLSGTDRPFPYQGAPELPKGDRVQVLITPGKGDEIAPVKWLTKVVGDKKMEVSELNWVFTGSWINYGRFMAQVDGSIIALYHDPVAIIDNASPGGESDRIWFAKEGATPPVGTVVTVTIKPLK